MNKSLVCFVTAALMFVAGFSKPAPAAPVRDSALVAATQELEKRIDSLSLVLKEAQLAAAYADKGMSHIIATDNKVMDNLYAFMAWMGGILVIAVAGLGFFIYKRTADERDFVSEKVYDMVLPKVTENHNALEKRVSTAERKLNDVSASYNGFSEQTSKDIGGIKGQLRDLEMHLGDTNKDIALTQATAHHDLAQILRKIGDPEGAIHALLPAYEIIVRYVKGDFYAQELHTKVTTELTTCMGMIEQLPTHIKGKIESSLNYLTHQQRGIVEEKLSKIREVTLKETFADLLANAENIAKSGQAKST